MANEPITIHDIKQINHTIVRHDDRLKTLETAVQLQETEQEQLESKVTQLWVYVIGGDIEAKQPPLSQQLTELTRDLRNFVDTVKTRDRYHTLLVLIILFMVILNTVGYSYLMFTMR